MSEIEASDRERPGWPAPGKILVAMDHHEGLAKNGRAETHGRRLDAMFRKDACGGHFAVFGYSVLHPNTACCIMK